jgi:hypothetical protein
MMARNRIWFTYFIFDFGLFNGFGLEEQESKLPGSHLMLV